MSVRTKKKKGGRKKLSSSSPVPLLFFSVDERLLIRMAIPPVHGSHPFAGGAEGAGFVRGVWGAFGLRNGKIDAILSLTFQSRQLVSRLSPGLAGSCRNPKGFTRSAIEARRC